MKTVTLKTEIAADGSIDLHISTDFQPGTAEVVVVVQPVALPVAIISGPPYPSDEGVWAGKLPDIDIEADSQEMNQLWEKSMELPE